MDLCVYLLADVISQENFLDFGGHALGVQVLGQCGQLVDAVRGQRVGGSRRSCCSQRVALI